ncbi:hypothetical protein [Magnetospira sp. QH-2]|uniref:hypothetical protein n=1 Tax=Magnetospira sp. (strain QH-2) TaxID=1288970 RepID=UPI0003E80AF3|nr:hypothetical protein [Magnetospira sp. QH-2]CCQ72750.1 protein of unknown function [Magnetospira sp. QH-2]
MMFGFGRKKIVPQASRDIRIPRSENEARLRKERAAQRLEDLRAAKAQALKRVESGTLARDAYKGRVKDLAASIDRWTREWKAAAALLEEY